MVVMVRVVVDLQLPGRVTQLGTGLAEVEVEDLRWWLAMVM